MPAAYTFTDVPPTGDSRTRFALGVAPNGFTSDPPATLALAANVLAEQRIRDAPRLQPEQRTLHLKRVAINSDGEYVLTARHRVTGTVTVQPMRPGKFKKTLASGPLLDSFLLGDSGYADYRDDAIWHALRDVCEQVGATGRDLRRLNDEVGRLIALRSGVVLDPSRIPS